MARRTALVVAALLLLIPGTASAADVSLSYAGRAYIQTDHGFETRAGYEIVYTAAGGEANRLSMTELDGGEAYRIEDTGATLDPSQNCTADGDAVVCRIPPPPGRGVAWLEADLGDGDDRTLTPIHGEVSGGPGDDVLAADGTLEGGPGADTLTGTGAGRLSYSGRSTGVSVAFDGLANDGEPGEGDDVRGTFAYVFGTSADDVLEASAPPSKSPFVHAEVYGAAGNDRLIGSAGNDLLDGGRGDDVLDGGEGDDRLIGREDADRTRGGDGTDTWDSGLFGLPEKPAAPGITITPDDRPGDGFRGEGDDVGSDIENFLTGSGNDRITGTGAANSIDSGSGDDTIVPLGGRDTIENPMGTGDTLRLRDGERDRARCSAGGFPLIAADAGDDLAGCASEVRFSPGSLSPRLSRAGTATLRARCVRRTGAPCTGTLRLYERGTRRLLASGRYRIRPNAGESVRVGVTHTGAKLLRRRGGIRFVATATPTGRRLASSAVHARGTLLRAR